MRGDRKKLKVSEPKERRDLIGVAMMLFLNDHELRIVSPYSPLSAATVAPEAGPDAIFASL
jgi:hypothetical protein